MLVRRVRNSGAVWESDDTDSADEELPPRRASDPFTKQKVAIDKLMRNPHKNLSPPSEADSDDDSLRYRPGSVAAASAGDFNRYAKSRRKEVQRLDQFDKEAAEEEELIRKQQDLKRRNDEEASKTAARRAKRLKKKQKRSGHPPIGTETQSGSSSAPQVLPQNDEKSDVTNNQSNASASENSDNAKESVKGTDESAQPRAAQSTE